jgi:RND superfamily putative drug exporter
VLGRVADLTWNRPKLVLAVIGALAVIAGGFGHDVEHRLTPAGFTDSASESEQASRVLERELGYDANPTLVALVRAPDGGALDVRDPAVRKEVERLNGVIAGAPAMGRVLDPVTSNQPQLVAKDGKSLVMVGFLDTLDVEAVGGDTNSAVKRAVADSSLDVGVTGYAAGLDETADQTRKDLTNAELIAFPALTVLLLLVFRGVIAAAIPLLIGVLSIVGTFLVLRVMSGFVDTSLFALNIATSLSLGLAVDYALLLVSRYREELARHGPTREAHRTTVLTAGRAALFSGLTVGAASAALIVMPQRFLYSIGAAGAAVGVLSSVLAVLVVPSLLRLLGSNVDKWSIRRGASVASDSSAWYRLSWGVMRRPVVVAVASTALLLAAAAPLLMATLTGPSAEAVPEGLQSYEPQTYVMDHYPRDINEAVTVAVDGVRGDLSGLEREIAALPHVARTTPFQPASDDVAFATVALDGPALAGTSQDAVRAIRRLAPPGGGELLVNGNTARFVDLKESLVANAPIVVALVAGGTLVLLFLLTGSVLLPLKTLLMNCLTIAATLGIMVLAFQEGVLAGPLDYPGPEAIEVVSMVFMFAVLFGLATDYAVLVMARIREHHEAGMSNEEAVATAMSRTGRVISAAAALIAVVFLAFAVSPVFFMKQIAVGLALGVIIDATIVRGLLVPALMRLLGKWNWWAPKPLKRLHARIGLQDA